MYAMLSLPLTLTGQRFLLIPKVFVMLMAQMLASQQKDSAGTFKIMLQGKLEDVMDVTVTFDCTCSKQGFTAPYEVAVVISWKS